LKNAAVNSKKRRKVVDKVAAALILKSYLEAHKEEGD